MIIAFLSVFDTIVYAFLRGYGGIGRHARFRNIRASNGDMAELADASDLGSDGVTRAGSSPVILTVYGQL